MKSKITELIDKQKDLIFKLQKANHKEIQSCVMEITFGLTQAQMNLYQEIVPDSLS
jgi:hypothetical protein